MKGRNGMIGIGIGIGIGAVARFWQRSVRVWIVALLMTAAMLTVSSVAAEGMPAGAVSPVFAHASGGTSVTISGSGFTGATAVIFGRVVATTFTVNTDTKIIHDDPGP